MLHAERDQERDPEERVRQRGLDDQRDGARVLARDVLPKFDPDLARVVQEAEADERGDGDVERDDDAGVREREVLAGA